MKWNCDLIQDLLPLYEEGLCSPSSRQAVEEHLGECDACRRLAAPLPIEAPPETPAADRAVKRSIKKVRRRWLLSLIASLLAVPLLLMSVNQYRGRGLCFTNIDDMLTARAFLSALEREDWTRAAELHDYSDDYASILEALEMTVSDWGIHCTPVTLSGEDWMLKSYAAREYGTPQTAEDLFSFLYNRHGNAMLTPELWAQVIAVDPSAFWQEDRQYWLNGDLYGLTATPWGDFITGDARRYDTAAEYCHHFDLFPAAIYEEAKADLEAEAQQLHAQTHAVYGYVADMTESEFLDHMEKSYAADLEEMSDQVSFHCTGYQGAYRLWENEGWHVQFGVTLTYRGKSLDTTMAFGIQDGRVHIVSLSYREQADWLDELERALYPSAHPDY